MIRVLLVEDEELIREGLRLTTPWQEWGMEVVGEAADGEAGMKKILELKPDVVITDVKMPKMSGLEMIEQLRGQVTCEYIILSGYDEIALVKQAIHLEVQEYLLKPVDDEELRAVMEQAAQRVHRKRVMNQRLAQYQEEEKEYSMDVRNIQDKYLDRAKEILRERYQENLTLKSVADALFISDSYLGKLFKNRTGYTFLEMLTFYRIRAAVEYLQNTDKKVYEIAYAIGYNDSKYFSRVFQRVTGMKPMELKNGHPLPEDHMLRHL